MDEEIRSLYKKIGLSERQIEILETIAEPKKHYYVTTPQGNRLIDLSFTGKDSLPLAFVGLTKKKGERLMACQKQYGQAWIGQWLRENDLSAWAAHYDVNEKRLEA